jgi:Tol biopolymer transport system component/DNA-binding winged helix-turn-helix (wHTH) protein
MNKADAGSYEFGPFRLDGARRSLLRADAVVPLSAKAFEMLALLIEHQGQVLEKDQLLAWLWPDSVVEEANLTVTISALRKALGENAQQPRYIHTVAGRGYKFVGEAKASAEDKQAQISESAPLTATTPPNKPAKLLFQFTPTQRLALSGVVCVCVAVFGWFVFSRQTSPPPARRTIPLTSLPGLKQEPAFAPDGKQIAFVWNGEQEDNQDIYLRQISAEGLLRLTTHPAPDTNPVWSPDGRYLAFLRAYAGGSAIYTIPALGGSERKLTDVRPSAFWQNLDWSPDGKYLAVSDKHSAEAPRGLILIKVETGERRQLTLPLAPNLSDGMPRFSPDGQQLAFARGASFFVGDIYVVPVAGGAAQQLTSDKRWLNGLTWTADSGEIVFSSNRGGLLGLWRVSASGGQPQALAAGDDAMFPAISRQGQQLAYARWKTDSNIWRVPGPQSETKERLPVKLIASTRDDALPQYSPDGQRIAFLSARTGSEEVWLCNSDGKNQIQLTTLNGAPGGSPRWSPDGRRIVFDCRLEGHGDIFIINVEGGAPLRLTNEASEDIVPSWSRDGRWIYFASNRSGSQQVWKVPAEGGAAVQVTQQGGFEAFESTDGKTLYFSKGNALWRMEVAGSAETQLLDGIAWGYWAVTAQGICYLNRQAIPRPAIELFNFATRQVSRLVTVEKDPTIPSPPGFAVSPDGRWILFKRIDQSDNDILLVENFR